ncbi:MAG: hypothetical protein HY070_08390 [Chloroflexi bacterium]|nr:hypothetical protein [Chloroflexota bacterium]
MNKNRFPQGWDEERVRRVLAHYESQSEKDSMVEDEAAFKKKKTVIQVPAELMPVIRELLKQYQEKAKA